MSEESYASDRANVEIVDTVFSPNNSKVTLV